MILYWVDVWPVHPGAAVRIVNDDPAGEELTPPTVGSFWVLSKAQVYSDWSVCKLSKFLIFKIPTLPQNLYSIFFFEAWLCLQQNYIMTILQEEF